MSWVIVSDVALDEKNGAGMRAIIPYLKLFPEQTFSSLFLYAGNSSGNAVPGVRYVAVPYTDQPGFLNLFRVFFRTFRTAMSQFKNGDHFLVVPNTIQDVLMGLACRMISSRITVWVMDDFIGTYAVEGRIVKRIYTQLFHLLYRFANSRIVVAEPMNAHYQKAFGTAADFILGRTLSHSLPPKDMPPEKSPVAKTKLRLVYIGSFLNHYFEPIGELKKLLQDSQHPLGIDLELDLYGIHPPKEEWLLPGKIHYKGPVPADQLLATLQSYDFGLIPYSFNIHTERMMSLSFPSKLIDYLGASLPVLVVAPAGLSFLETFRTKEVGISQTQLSVDSLREAIRKLAAIETPTYQRWQKNAHQWAQQDFILDKTKIQKILN